MHSNKKSISFLYAAIIFFRIKSIQKTMHYIPNSGWSKYKKFNSCLLLITLVEMMLLHAHSELNKDWSQKITSK